MYQGLDRQLIMADGSRYFGTGFGIQKGDKVCEIVFNTSPVGYQEILSDPSYTDQFVVMAYPLIGNYGINDEDYECLCPTTGGFVVRDYNDLPSNYRATQTMSKVMERFGIYGISGVDTREIVRKIRMSGTGKALITDASTSLEDGMRILNEYVLPTDAVSRVGRHQKENYISVNSKYHIAAIDLGMKGNILNSLLARGCSVSVFPYNATAEEVMAINPDALFLSNGPGDPTDAVEAIELVKNLRGQLPILGICLGHQIISLALGAKTYKLKFGHRGGNHPVKNIATGHIEITSQNHSYAVDSDSIEGTGLVVTHVNVLDKTVEGVKCEADRIYSVQYHPESCPGPHDSAYLFDEFLAMINK